MKNTKLHITALSDTHSSTWDVKMPEIPDDAISVLILAGDFSYMGKAAEIYDFSMWLKQQPHDHKLWIPGNHELSLEDFPYNIETIDNNANATCIHNNVVEIEDIEFFGSAMTPNFMNWAFMHNEEQAKRYWENAPRADVVVCHGPPLGILDSVTPDYPVERLGCKSFKYYLERTQPRIAIFGHIHGSGGQTEIVEWDNGNKTICANVSVMNEDYDITNKPTVLKI